VTTERRRRGTGTVEKVGDRYRFKCPDGAGGRYVSPADFTSPEEARLALAVYRKKIFGRELVPMNGLTLAQYAETYWIPRVRLRRPRSARVYENRYQKQVAPFPIASMPLRSVARRDIRRHLESLKQLRRPDHVLVVISLIFQGALEDELVTVNPARSIKLEAALVRKKPRLKPTQDEQQRLLTCTEIPLDARLILQFMLGLGDRPGEVWHAMLDDVHLDAERPYIDLRFGTKNGPTKGDDPDDVPTRVPLFGMALEALRAWFEYLPTFAPKNPLRLLFPLADGKRRHGSHPFGQRRDGRKPNGKPKWVSAWHEYRRVAGVTRPLRLHDMRHAAATDLLTGARGRKWTPYEVQALLRHASLVTTQGYIHRDEEALFTAAEESDRSTVSPRPDPTPLAIVPVPKAIVATSSAPSAGSRTSSQLPPVALIADSEAVFWTDGGLIRSAREALGRMLAGETLDDDEREALAVRIGDARRAALLDADPVIRAASRVQAGGPHADFALVELLELTIPDAEAGEGARAAGEPKR
jgi:integrase